MSKITWTIITHLFSFFKLSAHIPLLQVIVIHAKNVFSQELTFLAMLCLSFHDIFEYSPMLSHA